MQILVISHEYPQIGGGAGVTCALLAEQFVQAGHQVTVLTMAMPGLTTDGLHNGVHVIQVSTRDAEHPEVCSQAEHANERKNNRG